MKAQFLWLASAILLFSGVSCADSFYDVTGQLSVSGNNVCASSPCTETINFSFELDYSQTPSGFPYIVPGNVPSVVPGSVDITATGPLGSFTNNFGFISQQGYIDFLSDGFDEIDLYLGLPGFSNVILSGCQTETCVQDFVNAQDYVHGPPYTPPLFGVTLQGTAEGSVEQVPEGPELAMIGIAEVGILGGVVRYCRNFA